MNIKQKLILIPVGMLLLAAAAPSHARGSVYGNVGYNSYPWSVLIGYSDYGHSYNRGHRHSRSCGHGKRYYKHKGHHYKHHSYRHHYKERRYYKRDRHHYNKHHYYKHRDHRQHVKHDRYYDRGHDNYRGRDSNRDRRDRGDRGRDRDRR